jgi:malate dehydrogenase (oxaloacetate-decarboxylating)
LDSLENDVIRLHEWLRGKIEIKNRIPIDDATKIESTQDHVNKNILELIYTPGVAYAAKRISKDKNLIYTYTSKWNNVAIICDGTRVLGLGNIGPEAAIPIMEGKSVLFKLLAGVNAFPLCIAIQNLEDIVKFVKAVEPGFGAINIEDIESPKVLELVQRLQNELEIPVFHDDQHGTAVVTLAGLLNSLKLLNKKISDIKVIIAGAGSSGYGIFKLLHHARFKNIVIADSRGALTKTDAESSEDKSSANPFKKEIASKSNPDNQSGSLDEILKEADIFIGVTGRSNLLNDKMIKSMNKDPIIFALSNPDPEISPDKALKAGAKIVATGRSDYSNQVNNALVFPYVLRALLDTRTRRITENMLVSAAYAIAGLITKEELAEDFVIPRLNDPRLLYTITHAIKDSKSQTFQE